MNPNILLAAGFVLGIVLGYFARIWIALRKRGSLESKAQEHLETAESEAKKTVLAANEKAAAIIADAQKEERERKQDLRKLEDHLLKKEALLERQHAESESLTAKKREELERLKNIENEIKLSREKAVEELERVAEMSKEDARNQIMKDIERDSHKELAEKIVTLEREKKNEIEAKSTEIITSVIQRYARNCIGDVTTSVVNLPNEDIKGKVIGREGRNIRTFERLTGVELIVDETPESILISSFDPLRRELAKIALEKLIKDGRIQPAKIEEKVEEARLELEDHIKKVGEEAAFEVGILDLPKEIVYLLGRLNYRTSYGQNVLNHSIEMTHIAGMMASELHLKVDITKKAALLHDIGKAIDHEVEGSHVDIGRKLLKKYGIHEDVIKAMESHHDEYPYSSPEAHLVATADIISAARPGARRDTLEKYLKRLEDIERVVKSFEGINQAYAVSAGREVRVFVTPEKIDDFGALQLAKQVAAKIQSEVQYPGEVKVVVIREVKAVEYAK
ncbi:MAG: ribonuclease Y [Patescibacteria group bacterium]